jgi:uncharacterized membrane protein YczE
MRFVRAAASEVIGLFVGEWSQTIITVVILAAAWFVLGRVHLGGLAYVVALALAVQLIYAATVEGRRRARQRSNP